MKDKKRPSDVGSILAGALTKVDLGNCLKHARIVSEWERCAGEQVARRTHPERLDGTVLHCTVSSAPWMSELTYQKRSLIQNINSVVGAGTVTDIRFKTGTVPELKAAPDVDAHPKQKRPAPEPDEDRKDFIEGLISGIKDEELKETIRRAMEKAGDG